MLLIEKSDKLQLVVYKLNAFHLRVSDKLKFVRQNGLTDGEPLVLNCRFAFIARFSSEVRNNVETL